MAILDDKGRLFGKINLLDLVIVLAILAVVGRFAYQRLLGPGIAPVGENKVIQVTIKLPEVQQPTISELVEGVDIYDSKSNAYLGKVKAVKKEPALIVRQGSDGKTHETRSDLLFDLYVTVEGPGYVSPNGVTMAGIEMKVGRTNQLKTAGWAGAGPTWDINENP